MLAESFGRKVAEKSGTALCMAPQPSSQATGHGWFERVAELLLGVQGSARGAWGARRIPTQASAGRWAGRVARGLAP